MDTTLKTLSQKADTGFRVEPVSMEDQWAAQGQAELSDLPAGGWVAGTRGQTTVSFLAEISHNHPDGAGAGLRSSCRSEPTWLLMTLGQSLTSWLIQCWGEVAHPQGASKGNP